ncbi:hypothetical protein PSEUBRA_005607 [Kalmanozyma brasiliensis GHG001]|uniref:uncharacterized protein n=1 Tax=Kalmanozyma brasiliensis (strain GHG001) TaxID=1365824 RepID=UPI002867FD30|nr:uncharacterized protein PSEUBRA_005607 [Kalmanozyma brasiliensis GHG001]KAF6767534.1 hypothetical protein PSEUBRA_005607 [Kalmanozyma brasiliensis GHG001]
MSSHGDHPTKSQSSVPPKSPGHDQLPPWKKVTDTSKRFVKRDPQLAPLGAIRDMFMNALSIPLTVLGTVGLYLYFSRSKVSEAAREGKGATFPKHKDAKASGRGSDAPVVTGDAPARPKGAYYAESGSAPGGVALLLYPHLDKPERENLENLTVPRNEGIFGKTMKQAAVADQMQKNRDAERDLKGQEDFPRGRKPREEGDSLLTSNEKLAILHREKHAP